MIVSGDEFEGLIVLPSDSFLYRAIVHFLASLTTIFDYWTLAPSYKLKAQINYSSSQAKHYV